jgi:P4 family phage/plasmid primase-like protien
MQVAKLQSIEANTKERDKKRMYEDNNNISKLMLKLRDAKFVDNVVAAAAILSYDPEFSRNLDENIDLLCFTNGVYDLKLDIFREGCPDDYITLGLDYEYIEYDKNDITSLERKDFFRKIQPNKILRHYIYTLASYVLSGAVGDESFYVLTGSGANGKSKFMELLKNTLRDLFKPMNIMVLVGKRASSSSATPELADKKGIRLCPFDEPNATDEINCGFMKFFTGGDEIMARGLYSDPIYFKPQFKPFLLCNNLPNIRADDDGTWRRIKVIPFDSKFLNLNDSKVRKRVRQNGYGPNEFEADPTLSDKLKDWNQMFMAKLIYHRRKVLNKKGLVHPKIVTQRTDAYRKKCDIYQDFIYDSLKPTSKTTDIITFKDLYNCMKEWYKNNCDGRPPFAKEMREYFKQRMGNCFDQQKDCLTGYTVKGADLQFCDDLENIGSEM